MNRQGILNSSIRHKIAHLFGWNTGHVVSEISDGYIWIGFKCETCGCVQGRYPTKRIQQ